MTQLFPEYLDQGSKGPAVSVLQVMLKVLGFDTDGEIVVDGDYGEKTAAAVRRLQEDMKVDVDGNFGPQTREAFLANWELDVDALEAEAFCANNNVFYVMTSGGV